MIKTGLVSLFIILGFSVSSLANHSWKGYESKLEKVEGTIADTSFKRPHSTLNVISEGKTVTVILPSTNRLERRGLASDQLPSGSKIIIEGYQKTDNKNELRAERLTIDGKTVELR